MIPKPDEHDKTTPLISNDIEADVVFSPSDYIHYKRHIEKKEIPPVSSDCILVFETSFIDHAKKHLNAKPVSWFRDDVKIYTLQKQGILLLHVNYGAALSAIALEELIALGVNRFIILGSAGTLQDHIPLGSLVIAEKAIREEGVSYHYAKASKYAYASEELLERAQAAIRGKSPQTPLGTVWTTDSFYRETINKTRQYKSENVLCVDMETAALYTIAAFRNVHALSIFYVSDSIANLKWNPQFHHTNNEKTQQEMLELAIRILTNQSTS